MASAFNQKQPVAGLILGINLSINFFFFFLISKKIYIQKEPHENIRQNKEYREGHKQREKKKEKQENKWGKRKTNYKEEN